MIPDPYEVARNFKKQVGDRMFKRGFGCAEQALGRVVSFAIDGYTVMRQGAQAEITIIERQKGLTGAVNVKIADLLTRKAFEREDDEYTWGMFITLSGRKNFYRVPHLADVPDDTFSILGKSIFVSLTDEEYEELIMALEPLRDFIPI